MMLCESLLRDRIQPWLRDYDRLQSFAVILIYIQIGCALIGSLGALYNGVLLINLAISLFALVAIESSSQSLGRTYAVLLVSAIFLDISWFILFTHDIWNISSGNYGTFFIFSVKVTLVMQVIGFSVRLSSSLLWIQIYRLGVSYVDTTVPRETDFDLRNSFLSPATPAVVRQTSGSDDVLGGSIYDPAYYSSLFEDGQDNRCLLGVRHLSLTYAYHAYLSMIYMIGHASDLLIYFGANGQQLGIGSNRSTSTSDSPVLKPSIGRRRMQLASLRQFEDETGINDFCSLWASAPHILWILGFVSFMIQPDCMWEWGFVQFARQSSKFSP
ncbi:hypothetical protein FEM48_Zijuj04G0000500 [Ziziphus jujuba var. spinosa]|uniref:Uncharacterized protein n=1 Tax=Ziziphus jujuba var. spinosa TaxID=714518 RepID=A0A978VGN6_ZIZJJ|nr:hypothetical protein FEM48_Zijuj04G0000500 [Ziziphus jujuba var. spinosa]